MPRGAYFSQMVLEACGGRFERMMELGVVVQHKNGEVRLTVAVRGFEKYEFATEAEEKAEVKQPEDLGAKLQSLLDRRASLVIEEGRLIEAIECEARNVVSAPAESAKRLIRLKHALSARQKELRQTLDLIADLCRNEIVPLLEPMFVEPPAEDCSEEPAAFSVQDETPPEIEEQEPDSMYGWQRILLVVQPMHDQKFVRSEVADRYNRRFGEAGYFESDWNQFTARYGLVCRHPIAEYTGQGRSKVGKPPVFCFSLSQHGLSELKKLQPTK